MILPKLILVRLEPVGVTVAVSPGTNLLEAAQRAGIQLGSVCSGQADCGECRVTIIDGLVTPPTPEEKQVIAPMDLEQGVRLACCTRALGPVRVRV